MIPPLAATPPPEQAAAPASRGGDRFAGTLARAMAHGPRSHRAPATTAGALDESASREAGAPPPDELDADATCSAETDATSHEVAETDASELAGVAAALGAADRSAGAAPAPGPLAVEPSAVEGGASTATTAVLDRARSVDPGAVPSPTGDAAGSAPDATGPSEPGGPPPVSTATASGPGAAVTPDAADPQAAACRSGATGPTVAPAGAPERPDTAVTTTAPASEGDVAAPPSSSSTPPPARAPGADGAPGNARSLVAPSGADVPPATPGSGRGSARPDDERSEPRVPAGGGDHARPGPVDAASGPSPALPAITTPPVPVTTAPGAPAGSATTGAATVAATDAVRYLRELGPARAVQRLAVDLDGSMVAVRVDHTGTAPAVRVQVVDDPAGRLGGSWVTSVERTLAQSMRREDFGGDPDRRRRDHLPVDPDDRAAARAAGRRWARALGGDT